MLDEELTIIVLDMLLSEASEAVDMVASVTFGDEYPALILSVA
jgi:hypothetical protein